MMESEDFESKSAASAAKNDESGMLLTIDQYENLMALQEKNSIDTKGLANMMKASISVANIRGKFYAENSKKNDDTSWIVETGAKHHTCYDINWFTTYRDIEPISVNLPNGNTVQALCKRKVKISENLHIHYVLYLPDFVVNLISVSKLCKEQDCNVTFETDQCVIHERKDSTRAGLAKSLNGLYYLKAEKNENKAAKISSISAYDSSSKNVVPLGILWHLRLENLSHDRIQCMNKLYSYIPVILHIACDVCHMSRQKKLPFSIS